MVEGQTSVQEPKTIQLTEEEYHQLSEVLDRIIGGLEETVSRLDRIHDLLQDTIATFSMGQEAAHAHR